MSKKKLLDMVQELVELREMADELAAEIAAIEDEIKAHMDKAGTIPWRPGNTSSAGPW